MGKSSLLCYWVAIALNHPVVVSCFILNKQLSQVSYEQAVKFYQALKDGRVPAKTEGMRCKLEFLNSLHYGIQTRSIMGMSFSKVGNQRSPDKEGSAVLALSVLFAFFAKFAGFSIKLPNNTWVDIKPHTATELDLKVSNGTLASVSLVEHSCL